MVSVPAEGSVSSGVCSVVDVVGSSGGSSVGSSVGGTARGLGVSAGARETRETLILVLHLSDLSHQTGHPHHRKGPTSEVGEVHVLHGDDEVAGGGGHAGHDHGEGE